MKKLPFFEHQPYQKYSPNVFDDSLSLYEQIIAFIEFLNDVIEHNNEVTEYLIKFESDYLKNMQELKDFVNDETTKQDKDILDFTAKINKWIADFDEWVLSQGLEEKMMLVMEKWEESGRFEELILKATNLFGDIASFRAWDTVIIDKMKNEFLERDGTNVKEFGVKADGITNDSVALQRAFDSGVNLVFPSNSTIIVETPVWANKSNITYTFNNVMIKATKVMDYVLRVGHATAPNFTSNVTLNGVLTIEGSMLAKVGFFATNTRIRQANNIIVQTCTEKQYHIVKDPVNTSGWPSICSAVIMNSQATMGADFDWQTATDINNIGLDISADDCYIFNFSSVHQTKTIRNNGGNTYQKVHGWVINDYQLKNGIFFEAITGSTLSQMYSDTYRIDYQITKKITLKVSDSNSYYNQSYYTLDKIIRGLLQAPIKINFVTEASKTSQLTFINTKFSGAGDGGGFLTNAPEYLKDMEFTGCVFDNLKNTTFELTEKNDLQKTWETGELVSKNASSAVITKDQIASVTLKPFTIVAESVNGEFSPTKGGWYKKNSDSTLAFANDILTVTGTGKASFAGEYKGVNYETWLFIRFRFKCAKEARLNVVNQMTGKTIGDATFTIYQKDGWHDEYFMFKVPAELTATDVEFIFNVNTTSTTETNIMEITELTLFDTTKRHIGYLFETRWDLAERLSGIGYVRDSRTLPLPTGQDFIIKSIPKNYGYRNIVEETDALLEYTAYRDINGLVVSGKTGTSPYKTFRMTFGLTEDARLRGSLYHYGVSRVNNVVTTKVFPDNTFSDDIFADTSWKTIHFIYKNKVQPISVLRTNKQIIVSKLLTSNENVSGNRVTIEDSFITPISKPEVFKTPFLNSTSGYYKIPIFKDGAVAVMSGGGGFADVEILMVE